MTTNLPETLSTEVVSELTGLSTRALKPKDGAAMTIQAPDGSPVRPARTTGKLLWPTRRIIEALSLKPAEAAEAIAAAERHIDTRKAALRAERKRARA